MAMTSVTRSCVYTPANVRRHCEGMWLWGPDSCILDLEDAVAPARKPEALRLLREHVPLAALGGAQVMVRINHDTVEEDCEASVWPGVASIYYPKAELPEEIRRLDRIISRLEIERGIEPGTIAIKPLIETALGLVNAYALACASPRVRAYGETAEGDMTASLGVPYERLKETDVLAYPRSEVDLVARALDMEHLGKLWVQGPTTIVDFGDPDRMFEAATLSLQAGFRGQRSAHPAAVDPINRGYTPTEDMIAQAREAVEAYEQAVAKGDAYGVCRGRVADARVARQARELLDYAEACQAKDRMKATRMAELKAQQEQAKSEGGG